MGDSLFQRKPAANSSTPPTPHELIQKEVAHLKKRSTARLGDKPARTVSLWVLVVIGLGLLWLYAQDPILHAWYKDDAIKAYAYLHNHGTGKDADQLAGCGIMRPEEVVQLNQSLDPSATTYATPKDAAEVAQTVLAYVSSVKMLHTGHYESLDPVGRVRYTLFIRPGIPLPVAWDFLDPSVPDNVTPAPQPQPQP